jgi:hypothetical protein
MAATFAMYRFILSLALAVGGALCIVYGYRLFVSGAGLTKGLDKISIKNRDFQISAAGMSVGAVLMLNSFGWAYFAYASAPKLELAGDLTKITQTPVKTKSDTALSTSLPAIGLPVVTTQNEPVGTIKDVLVNDYAQTTGIVIQTGQSGRTITVNPNSIGVKGAGPDGVAVINMSKDQLQSTPDNKGATIHR